MSYLAALAFGDVAAPTGLRDKATVTAVQTALKQRALPPSGNPAFDPGEVDGLYSSKTKAAIAAWQEASYQTVTGEIDSALLASLGLHTPGATGPSIIDSLARIFGVNTQPNPGPTPTPTPAKKPASRPSTPAPSPSPPPAAENSSSLGWALGAGLAVVAGGLFLRRRRRLG